MLGSEYGWSKRDILNDVYPDELIELQAIIVERKRSEYAMQLAISHNPHSQKPEELWDNLRPDGREYLDAELDREGMEALKRQLGLKHDH